MKATIEKSYTNNSKQNVFFFLAMSCNSVIVPKLYSCFGRNFGNYAEIKKQKTEIPK